MNSHALCAWPNARLRRTPFANPIEDGERDPLCKMFAALTSICHEDDIRETLTDELYIQF